jgi:hypothetical protein
MWGQKKLKNFLGFWVLRRHGFIQCLLWLAGTKRFERGPLASTNKRLVNCKLNVIILEFVFVNPKFIRCQIGLLKLYEGALEASKDKFLLTKAAPGFMSHVLWWYGIIAGWIVRPVTAV